LAQMNTVIQAENLSFDYSPDAPLLRQISFSLTEGSFLAIVGPNGAGKTTLLNLLCRRLRPDAGRIYLHSNPLAGYSQKRLAQLVSVVPQQLMTGFDFTVYETVMMARTPYLPNLGFQSARDNEIVTDALRVTGTERFADRFFAELSGGERRRVLIARALAQDADLLLLDEPTSSLDIRHQIDVYDLIRKLQLRHKKTIVTVTHDLNLAAQYCDRVLLLASDTEHWLTSPGDMLDPEQIARVFSVKMGLTQLAGRTFILPIGQPEKQGESGKQR